MKIVIQKVTQATLTCEGEERKIGKGLVVLICTRIDDIEADMDYMVEKILGIRLWDDDQGKPWAKSVVDIQGEILFVSQFTLYGYLKGNKPDFHYSMKNQDSAKMHEYGLSLLKKKYKPEKVQSNIFGADQQVNLTNDGPCTFVMDSRLENRVEGVEGMQKIGGQKAWQKHQQALKKAAKEAAMNETKENVESTAQVENPAKPE